MKKYFEVELSNFGENGDYDQYSMCIIGERKPSIEEAEWFLKSDMEMLGYKYVQEILEIDKWEAHMYFNMDGEENFPIFR